MRVPGRALAPLGGLALAGVLFASARGLDEIARADQLGPGFWPRLVLVGLGLACLAKLVQELRHAAARPRRVVAGAPRPPDLPEISHSRLAVAIALIVLYVAATPWLGFPLVTATFILTFMWLCGTRGPLGLAANAAIGTVGLLYLFVKIVYLPLPKGAGPFETLTLALYRALHIL